MSYYKLLLKKTVKNRSNILLLAILLLGVVGLYILNLNAGGLYSYTGQVKDQHSTTIELEEYYQKVLNDDVEYSEGDIQSFEDALEDTLEQKEWNEKILELAEQEKWSEALDYSIQISNRDLDVNEKTGGELFPDEYVLVLEQEKALYEQLAFLNQEPDSEGYEVFGFNYVYRFMDSLFPIFFVLIISVFITEMFVSTYKHGFNSEILLPSSYMRTTLRKIIYSTLASICIYVFILLISLGLASIINQSGSIHYPIILYGSEAPVTAPVWIIITKTFTLHALSILSIVLLISIISYLTKNRMITLLISVVIIIGSSMAFKSLDTLHSVIHLNPFTYFLGADVVTNLIAYQTGNSGITFENGVFFLSILAILLIATTLLLGSHKKKTHMLARK